MLATVKTAGRPLTMYFAEPEPETKPETELELEPEPEPPSIGILLELDDEDAAEAQAAAEAAAHEQAWSVRMEAVIAITAPIVSCPIFTRPVLITREASSVLGGCRIGTFWRTGWGIVASLILWAMCKSAVLAKPTLPSVPKCMDD